MRWRPARGREEILRGCRLLKISRNIVSKVTAQLLEKLTWKQVRLKASKLGVPAWALAENLAFHQNNGELVVQKPLKSE